jgi:hypothetical protein
MGKELKLYKGMVVECGCDRDFDQTINYLNMFPINHPNTGKYNRRCKRCRRWPWMYRSYPEYLDVKANVPGNGEEV